MCFFGLRLHGGSHEIVSLSEAVVAVLGRGVLGDSFMNGSLEVKAINTGA